MAKYVHSGKYGKYFFSGSDRVEDGEHGVTLAVVDQQAVKSSYGCLISWLYPRETPYGTHPAHIHENAEYLIQVGTNVDNPFDLGSEIELCMGKEMGKHTITRPTVVYVPPGFIHSPWTIKKVNQPFIFMQIPHGAPRGSVYYPQLLPENERDIMKY